MDSEYFDEIKMAKQENYEKIYFNKELNRKYNEIIEPMFRQIYDKLYDDLINGREDSLIFKHHMNFVRDNEKYYDAEFSYRYSEPNQIVVDYLASMTDDYFVDLYKHLFPNGKYSVDYISYFDNSSAIRK